MRLEGGGTGFHLMITDRYSSLDAAAKHVAGDAFSRPPAASG